MNWNLGLGLTLKAYGPQYIYAALKKYVLNSSPELQLCSEGLRPQNGEYGT